MACTFPFLGLKRPSYDTTEVIDLTTKKSHIAGSLTTPRQNHGMSVMKIGKTYKLITFGGESMEGDGLLDSIEVWNSQTEIWEESKSLKLEDKVSRFSSLTVYNNSRSASLINIPLPEDEPKPYSPLDTDNKFIRAYRMAFAAPVCILLMVCYFSRLIPEGLWISLKLVACYEMTVLSSTLSLSRLIGVKNSQTTITSRLNQLLNLFNHPVIMLPRIFGHHVHQFLKTFTQNYEIVFVYIICLTIFVNSREICFRLLNIVMHKMYHETLQVILFLNFEKMYSVLMKLKQLSKNNSFLQQVTRIISDPIVALLIIVVLMNSESSLRIVSFTLFFVNVVVSIIYFHYDEIGNTFQGVCDFCLLVILIALTYFLLAFGVVAYDNEIEKDLESKAVVLYYNIPKNMCMPLKLTY